MSHSLRLAHDEDIRREGKRGGRLNEKGRKDQGVMRIKKAVKESSRQIKKGVGRLGEVQQRTSFPILLEETGGIFPKKKKKVE